MKVKFHLDVKSRFWTSAAQSNDYVTVVYQIFHREDFEYSYSMGISNS